MSALRTALILILAGAATPALADRITCESHGGGAEACGTVQPRSTVRVVKQLSHTPCVQEQNWGLGPDHDSIWVSGGCRAVFDVQPPRNDPTSEAQYRDSELRDQQRGAEPSRDEQGDEPRRDEQFADEQGQDEQQDEPRRDEQRGDDRRDGRDSGSHYARVDMRANARDACIDQAASGQAFGPDEVSAGDAHWIGHGMLSVSLDTPDGPMTCTVDGDGNVQSIDNR